MKRRANAWSRSFSVQATEPVFLSVKPSDSPKLGRRADVDTAWAQMKDDLCRSSERWNKESKKEVCL
jgi:hypothetical protein